MSPPPLTIVEAPSILGLRPTGVEELPRALERAGLHAQLRAREKVVVAPLPYDDRRDPVTGFLNPLALVEYTRQLADAVGRVLERGDRLLVLGGDCTIMLGNLLALARRGRPGFLFFDGHADFYQPEANVNGEAASSELALATGRGPAALTHIDGHTRLVRDEDVIAIGTRDQDEARSYASQPLAPAIASCDLATVRDVGPERAIENAVGRLRANGVDAIWIHLDADVLDDDIMPAVDYRLPGGLSWDEAETMLSRAWQQGVVGMDLTIFNPRLDRDGRIGRSLVELLVRVLNPVTWLRA
jgi:arginase